MDDRLYRSRTDRMLAGVCGGLADRLAIDPSLVRIGWVVLTLVSGGIFLVIYIVMALVVPEQPPAGWPTQAAPPGPGAVPGWNPPTSTGGASSVAAAGAAAGPPTAGPDAPTGTPAGPTAAPGGWQPPGPAPAPSWSAAPPPPAEHDRRGGGAVLVVGLGLIILGGWLFLRPYIPDFGIDLRSLWPLAVIGLGIFLVVAAVRPGPRGG